MKKTKVCTYPGCTRPAWKGRTTCARHYTAGRATLTPTQGKVALAREIAYRTKPRFVDIPREKRVTRSTVYRKLVAQHPEIETARALSAARKEREERN